MLLSLIATLWAWLSYASALSFPLIQRDAPAVVNMELHRSSSASPRLQQRDDSAPVQGSIVVDVCPMQLDWDRALTQFIYYRQLLIYVVRNLGSLLAQCLNWNTPTVTKSVRRHPGFLWDRRHCSRLGGRRE